MKKYLIAAGCLAVLILIVVQTRQDSDSPAFSFSLNRQALAEEFNEAFPLEATPNGQIVEHPITAELSEIQLPSGTITNSWTYNGTTPGPEIRLSIGDTLRIPFTNNLPDETTIHFHGIRVPHAMDGVPGVTQEAVAPGDSFVYEFTPKDVGTFWFHPHVRGAEQLERGLYGTIIVEDDYTKSLDQDKVIILDDWRLSSASTINETFNHPHDVSHDGRWGDITVNNKISEIITAQPGERVRLRLINTANGRVFQPVFSQSVELVAVDGMSLERPIAYETMEVSPGNRIDIEFTAESNFTVIDTFFGKRNPLIDVQVSGEETSSSVIEYPDDIHIPNWDLDEIISVKPDIEYVLDADGGGMMGMMAFNWSINHDLYGQDTPLTLNYDEASKVRFRNDSLRFHPMHLHGQFFKVIARNGEAAPEPYWRDTVLVGGTETIDVVLMPRDKGEWAMHCHIQEHAEAGMMTTLIIE